MDDPILTALRQLSVALLHPSNENCDALLLQLRRVGCRVKHYRTMPARVPDEFDLIVWMADRNPDGRDLLTEATRHKAFGFIAVVFGERFVSQ